MMTPEAFIESLRFRSQPVGRKDYRSQLGQADTETLQAVHDLLSPRYVMHGYSLPEGIKPLSGWELSIYRYTGYLIDWRTKPFSVYEWGSHPDAGNDDCWCGSNHQTEAEARKQWEGFKQTEPGEDDAWYELIGPGVREVYHQKGWRKGPPQEETCTEWATLQGMSHGVEAYNEAIGSPLDTDEH